jgi:hypothetical protein
VERPSAFFHGSELPRLVILTIIMVVGWTVVWRYILRSSESAEPPVTVAGRPEPVVPDRSEEFETVTDRTPMSFRDGAGYARLLDRARSKTPSELAAVSRRDIVLTHLWERPELYRGVPIHLLGAANYVIRYEAKQSQNGWLYEAWIYPQETRKVPYVCVFEDAPKGLPIGTTISERVVFNGYFLKIMKYEAGDVARGAPVLIGRIGWDPRESSSAQHEGMSPTLRWTLIAIGAMFLISLVRWIVQLRRLFTAPTGPGRAPTRTPTEEIAHVDLEAWAQSMAREDDTNSDPDRDADER